MEFIFRKYEAKDETSLEGLIVYLQNFERNLENTILDKGENIAKRYLQNLLNSVNSKSGQIFVAETGRNVIGMVAGYVEESPEEIELLDKRYFYISDLVVLPEFQKQGIGRALISKIEHYAKTLNVKQIEINVLARNSVAFEAYVKQGFREYEKILIKEF